MRQRIRLMPILLGLVFLAIASVAGLPGCDDDGDDDSPCAGINCGGHGQCLWDSRSIPYCDCDPGYTLESSMTVCVEDYGNINNVKPIIYLYPEETTRVRVRFAAREDMELAFTYPAYPETGWDVIAAPDGTLADPQTGRKYYALYWEGTIAEPPVPAEGFIVAGADVAAFLEDQLPRLGLNWAEADEFIIYWLPILGENPWNFLTFLTDAWGTAVPLSVEPAPDTVIRFGLRWARLEAPPAVLPAPQSFTPPERRGFTLVEWGGRELPAPGR